MGKGGGGGQQVNTQVTEPPAYAKPFLEFGLSQAKDLFESDVPQYFLKQQLLVLVLRVSYLYKCKEIEH